MARETSATSDMQMTESEEKLKNLLMGVKEETEKASVKLNIKLISWHPAPSLHGK